jgi:hypothetical protein
MKGELKMRRKEMSKKRDLYDELLEGFDALHCVRTR